ncbi:MAG: dTDP-4-dehydrorhamnose reductase [Bacteroidales bacterium]|nr:dTDP-4-dehydrorhamnose reductase [Bacteroidales bacterium]
MNILVTGTNGQLGSHIRLCSAQSQHNYLYTDINELDITNRAAVERFVQTNQINVIVNCAAYVNVDQAESDKETADKLNHIAVGYLADIMSATNGLLIHISTDYVFGGNKNNTPCTEAEPTNPTGAYGRTKLAGEQAILQSSCRHIILRTSWLYSETGKNFCKTMLALTASKPSIKVVFDQVGTPTYAGDLAKAIFTILERGLYEGNEGTYNFSNEGVCSWYDFAKEIARQSNQLGCDIQPCHSNEFPSPVIRPSYSVLDKTKFKETFGMAIPYWADSLAVCLSNLGYRTAGTCNGQELSVP